jgi:hypothetical protein
MNAALAVELLIAIINQAATISALLSKAQAENRDVTQAELDSLALADDLSRATLIVAISARRAQESKQA